MAFDLHLHGMLEGMESLAVFAACYAALYTGHHIGDYWIQSHDDALNKQKAGQAGVRACVRHTLTYVTTQSVCLAIMARFTGMDDIVWWNSILALLISGITHYTADRGPHGLMYRIARKLPWKRDFLDLGRPRPGRDDNPQLATGAWALDQSWHIAFGVFVPALVLAL